METLMNCRYNREKETLLQKEIFESFLLYFKKIKHNKKKNTIICIDNKKLKDNQEVFFTECFNYESYHLTTICNNEYLEYTRQDMIDEAYLSIITKFN